MQGRPLVYLVLEREISAVDTKAGVPVLLWIFSIVQIRVSTEITKSCPKEIQQCKKSSTEGLDDIRTIFRLSFLGSGQKNKRSNFLDPI